jgi:hypothetical protein
MGITDLNYIEADVRGTKLPLYWDADSKTEGYLKGDGKVWHEIPKREGSKVQYVGRSSRVVEGTILVTDSMWKQKTIDEYESELKAFAENEIELKFTEDDGRTSWKAQLFINGWNKSPDITPNMIKADITIIEYNQ